MADGCWKGLRAVSSSVKLLTETFSNSFTFLGSMLFFLIVYMCDNYTKRRPAEPSGEQLMYEVRNPMDHKSFYGEHPKAGITSVIRRNSGDPHRSAVSTANKFPDLVPDPPAEHGNPTALVSADVRIICRLDGVITSTFFWGWAAEPIPDREEQ